MGYPQQISLESRYGSRGAPGSVPAIEQSARKCTHNMCARSFQSQGNPHNNLENRWSAGLPFRAASEQRVGRGCNSRFHRDISHPSEGAGVADLQRVTRRCKRVRGIGLERKSLRNSDMWDSVKNGIDLVPCSCTLVEQTSIRICNGQPRRGIASGPRRCR
jgi:hypothetical protein